MITINVNKITNKVVFTIPLTADCNLMGLLEPLSVEPKDIDTTNLVDEFITGETTSKLSYIKRSFPAGQIKVGEAVVLRGTDIVAVVTKNDPEHKEYIMYLNKDGTIPVEPFDDEYFSVSKGEVLVMPVGSMIYDSQVEGVLVLLSKDFLILDSEVLKPEAGEWARRSGAVYTSKTTEPDNIQLTPEYVGYKFPSIMYTDIDGVTTFKYKVPKETGYPTDTAFILKHWGIIDEPKLDTNLFIDRGVNNVFESFKRLKTVNNLQELQKTGFGFFNLYSKGVI